MLLSLLLFALLLVYSLTSGYRDAIAFSRMGADAVKFNVHLPLVVERAAVLCIALVGTRLAFVQVAIVGLAWVQAFSIVRDYSYYTVRHVIDPTQPDFSLDYGSSTSTAKLEITPKQRLVLLFTGLATLGLLVLV